MHLPLTVRPTWRYGIRQRPTNPTGIILEGVEYFRRLLFIPFVFSLRIDYVDTQTSVRSFCHSYTVTNARTMADPEVGLPRATSEYSIERSTPPSPGIKKADDEVRATNDIEKNSSTSSIDNPIVWHYLTYETDLPSPTALPSTGTTSADYPEPPNLAKYVSPFDWPESRKTFITWLSCVATAVTAYTAGSYSSGEAQMAAEWGVSELAVTVGITTFTTGFGVMPMVLAPFSEINGRRPVFIVTGTLFVLMQLCCAVTRSYPGMLVARFFAGCFSSTFSTMVGGVVSDIYHTRDRNTPMALFSGAALFGTGLGPLVSGFIAAHTTW